MKKYIRLAQNQKVKNDPRSDIIDENTAFNEIISYLIFLLAL